MVSAVQSGCPQNSSLKTEEKNASLNSSKENQLQVIPYPKIKSLMQSLDVELSRLCKVTPADQLDQLDDTDDVVLAKELSNYACLKTPKLLPYDKTRNPFKCRAYDAYKKRKIFTVYGDYHAIRKELLLRGWLEKLPPGRLRKLQQLPEYVLQKQARPGNDYELAALSQAISSFPPFFIWQPKWFRDFAADVLPYRNNVRRAPQLEFSTKIGLIGCAEYSHWYGEHELNFPRTYCLDSKEDIPRFTTDFRMTQCTSFLCFVCDFPNPAELADCNTGTVKLTTLNFAINKIENELMDQANCFIDVPIDKMENADVDEEADWQHFLKCSNYIVKRTCRFNATESQMINLVQRAKHTITMVKLKHPSMRSDGYRNLWILKPGYQCRGLGIAIMGNLSSILTYASRRSTSKYIAQKYIERPFLIYKTKFDIRQYLLVSITTTAVEIWIYKNCYLRFSSQEFSLENLDEAVHITNNSVQKKYKNGIRDHRLPVNNMWSLLQFKEFLCSKYGSSSVWDEKIRPGIKQNLISIVLSSLEETALTPNAFELYGCDLMLDEELKPILIEVNSTPDMSPSTSVTAQICNQTLRDLVKVIVDQTPSNSIAPTGDFELAYQINYTQIVSPPNSLTITGKSCKIFPPEVIKKRVLRKRPTSLVLPENIVVAPTHNFDEKDSKKNHKDVTKRSGPKVFMKKSPEGSEKYWRRIKGSKRKA